MTPDEADRLPEVVDAALALGRALRACGWMIATAESCTGGLLASRLTDVPGASEVFGEGFVTYSNAAKIRALGVPEEWLQTHGAVSECVAGALAEGALGKSGADFALATTGIAGPGGGTPEKPVGTVFIGLAQRGGETEVFAKKYPVSREEFKIRVTQFALDALRRRLG